MNNLTNRIHAAQVRAGEQVVLDDLRARGLAEGQSPASPEGLAIFRDTGIGSRLLAAAEKYAAEYVFDDGESSADHEPTEFERVMMSDMLNGLFSDEAFSAILQEAARGMKAGGLDPEGIDRQAAAGAR